MYKHLGLLGPFDWVLYYVKIRAVYCGFITCKRKMYDHSNIRKGEMEENWSILFLTDFSLPN